MTPTQVQRAALQARAAELRLEGKSYTAIARLLNVSPHTIRRWRTSGELDRLAEKLTARPKTNLLLPVEVSAPEIQKQLAASREPGTFSQTAADAYKSLWFSIRRQVESLVESGEPLDPKSFKDWIDTLRKLSDHVETHEAKIKPEKTQDELAQARELRERSQRMRALYKEDSA